MTTQNGRHSRKLRNYLLDKRFQLKYTFASMAMSAVISIGLGIFLYNAYGDIFEAHQEIYQAHRENSQLISLDPSLDQALAAELRLKDEKIRQRNEHVKHHAHNILIYLTLFLGFLVVSLGIISIVATHKIAGPAFAIRRIISQLYSGQLNVSCKLRKGDELQPVATELQKLIDWLQTKELQDIEKLQSFLAKMDPHVDGAKNLMSELQEWIRQKQSRLIR